MDKLVGIIYSPEYGAGWSSWGCKEMALDQELAKAITEGLKPNEILEIAKKNWPDEYTGGLDDCRVEWVKQGTQFFIEEYDGYESITFRGGDEIWQIAE